MRARCHPRVMGNWSVILSVEPRMARYARWRTLSLVLVAAACGDDVTAVCILPPCAIPLAVTVTVTTASGAAISGAFVRRSIDGSPAACDVGGVCTIPGTAATYELDIGAPGFTTVHRSVVVTGTTPECGCPSVNAQRLAVALTPGA